MNCNFKPTITLFHCINTFGEALSLTVSDKTAFELKSVKLPCSSLIKDIFLLKAFEAGSDAVVVLTCPEGTCRYVEGNIRAKKRIGWVKKILNEIGIEEKRLSLFNINHGDRESAARIIDKTLSDLNIMGPIFPQ
jgi:F420-non-reducing hydrogenase iron-sulfur subunit